MDTRVKKKINFKGKLGSIDIGMHKHSWRITALVEGDVVLTVTLAIFLPLNRPHFITISLCNIKNQSSEDYPYKHEFQGVRCN